MKPAFNHSVASVIDGQPPQQGVYCLRCNQRLAHYHLTRFADVSNGSAPSQAMLVCPGCGHVEFIAEGSSLLDGLELVHADTGDGD